MNKERFIGFLKLSFAHHPLCWQYRLHTLHIGRISLCLGCTGFYSGVFIGGLMFLFKDVAQLDWLVLVIITLVLASPTIVRLLNLPFFNTTKKQFRFLFRFLLGIGVSFGLASITKAPNVFIGFSQFALGVVLYLGIGYKRIRSKDMWTECHDCTFTMSFNCPGFSPFNLGKQLKNGQLRLID